MIHIVGLLDDAAVSQDGTAVYEVAYQVKNNYLDYKILLLTYLLLFLFLFFCKGHLVLFSGRFGSFPKICPRETYKRTSRTDV